jgi:hypothetical protein
MLAVCDETERLSIESRRPVAAKPPSWRRRPLPPLPLPVVEPATLQTPEPVALPCPDGGTGWRIAGDHVPRERAWAI